MGSQKVAPCVSDLRRMHVADLMKVPRESLLELWTHLPAPAFEDVRGTYEGLVHYNDDKDILADQMEVAYNKSGNGRTWLGKSFKADNKTKGEGCNRIRSSSGEICWVDRFATYPGTSSIDGKAAFIVDYSPFDNVPGRDLKMKDEIRVLGKHTYLCIAVSQKVVKGLTPRPRADGQGAEPEFFFLGGPVDSWRQPDNPGLECP